MRSFTIIWPQGKEKLLQTEHFIGVRVLQRYLNNVKMFTEFQIRSTLQHFVLFRAIKLLRSGRFWDVIWK